MNQTASTWQPPNAGQFLDALGISTASESLRGTPGRMARAYAELFSPRPFDLTTFPNDEGYDELVLARRIPVRSVCEHHLLPFVGTAHVGYLPGARILGRSELARIVEHFACRPQEQERLTRLRDRQPHAQRRHSRFDVSRAVIRGVYSTSAGSRMSHA